MRPVFKYIFCGLVLAALIFISFCVFYIANTYSVNTRNKNKPIFDNHSASYLASAYYADISEIEEIQPSDSPQLDGTGSLDGSENEQEPSSEIPEIEPNEELEQLPESEPEINKDTEAATLEDETIIDKPYTDAEIIETFESYEASDGLYTETELLYSILETMKINQYIMLFVMAVALIIIIFKPINRAFFG